MHAEILGCAIGPARKLVGCMAGPAGRIAGCLKAIVDKAGEERTRRRSRRRGVGIFVAGLELVNTATGHEWPLRD